MLVALQLVGVAVVPLNFTVLLPCVPPKFVPVIVTTAPTAPEVGSRLVRVGVARTVKATSLLVIPPTVTDKLPVVAPDGTGATMAVELQLVGVAAVPLNITVLLPCVAPKLVPLIVMDAPTAPEVELMSVISGDVSTVKAIPLLGTLDTVTTRFPDVLPLGTEAMIDVFDQLLAVAVVPLNVTVLLPWLEPKFEPRIETFCPVPPLVGERLHI
jgi:hypothetical protein